MQHAGFQHKDTDVQMQALNNMAEHHIFRTQAAALSDQGRSVHVGLGAGCHKFHGGTAQQVFSDGQLDGKVGRRLGVQVYGGMEGAHAVTSAGPRANKGGAVTASPW